MLTVDECGWLASAVFCRARVAYKVLPNANVEARRAATPSATGSGMWSWWADPNPEQVGTDLDISKQPVNAKTVADCLASCNDDSECAGVRFTVNNPTTFAMTQTVGTVACKLFKGLVVEMGTSRTMIRTRLNPTAGIAPARS